MIIEDISKIYLKLHHCLNNHKIRNKHDNEHRARRRDDNEEETNYTLKALGQALTIKSFVRVTNFSADPEVEVFLHPFWKIKRNGNLEFVFPVRVALKDGIFPRVHPEWGPGKLTHDDTERLDIEWENFAGVNTPAIGKLFGLDKYAPRLPILLPVQFIPESLLPTIQELENFSSNLINDREKGCGNDLLLNVERRELKVNISIHSISAFLKKFFDAAEKTESLKQIYNNIFFLLSVDNRISTHALNEEEIEKLRERNGFLPDGRVPNNLDKVLQEIIQGKDDKPCSDAWYPDWGDQLHLDVCEEIINSFCGHRKARCNEGHHKRFNHLVMGSICKDLGIPRDHNEWKRRYLPVSSVEPLKGLVIGRDMWLPQFVPLDDAENKEFESEDTNE